MKDYKLYLLGRADHIEKRIDLLDCEDDARAIRAAAKLADGRAMELWFDGKLLKRFERTDPGK